MLVFCLVTWRSVCELCCVCSVLLSLLCLTRVTVLLCCHRVCSCCSRGYGWSGCVAGDV